MEIMSFVDFFQDLFKINSLITMVLNDNIKKNGVHLISFGNKLRKCKLLSCLKKKKLHFYGVRHRFSHIIINIIIYTSCSRYRYITCFALSLTTRISVAKMFVVCNCC